MKNDQDRPQAGPPPDDEASTSFALVRPYVAPATDRPAGPAWQPRGARQDPPTEPIAALTTITVADEPRAEIGIHTRPGPWHVILIAAASIIAIGSAVGLYVSVDPHAGIASIAAAPAPVLVSALPSGPVTSAPAPSAATPTSAHPRTSLTHRSPTSSPPRVTHTPTPATTTPSPGTPSASPTPAGSEGPALAPTDLARGRSVTDSGHEDAFDASNAVDGDSSSYWESADNAFPGSITIDLGQPTGIGRIVVQLPPQPAWGSRTQTFTVLDSSDGSDFTTLVRSSTYDFDVSTGNATTLTVSPMTTRYVRLTFTANSVWPAGQASGIEIYAS